MSRGRGTARRRRHPAAPPPLPACVLCLLLASATAGCGGEAPRSADTAAPAAVPVPARRRDPPPRLLDPAAPPLTRTITADEVHRFDLDVAAGDLVVVEVEQLGADVEVRLRGPDGGVLLVVDRPTGGSGREALPWIAAEGGRHRVELETWDDPGAELGQYAVRLLPPRPPAAADRRWLEGERTYARARELRDAGDLAAAEAGFAAAAAEFAAAGRVVRQAEAVRGVAFARLDRAEASPPESADPEWSLAPWRRAAELYAEAGDTLGVARMRARLGDALTLLGRRGEAEAERRRVLALTAAPERGPQRAVAHHELGILLAERGETEAALAHFEAALGLGRPEGEEAVTLRLLGSEYFAAGLPRRALARLRQALEIYRRLGDARGEARTLTRLAWVLEDRGELDAAEAAIRRALALHRRLGDRRGVAVTLSFLHDVAVARRDWDGARRALEESLAVFAEDGAEFEAAIVRNNLGWLDLAVGRPADARARFEAALPALAAYGDPREEANTLLGLGTALADAGRLEDGLEVVERSIAVVERLRRGAASRTLRSHQLARRYGHYDTRIELLMRLHEERPDAGWAERAFAAFEQARARALLDTLASLGPASAGPAPSRPGGGTGGDPERRRDELAGELAALERRRIGLVWDGAPGADVRAVESRLEDVELALQRAESSLRPAAAAEPLDLAAVRREVLDDDSLLLAYHLGRRRSFLWLVGRDVFEAHELPPRAEVEAAARRAHARVAEGRRRTGAIPAARALADLSDLLLVPAAGHLGGEDRRLLVVGDGALLYVPFAALPLPGSGAPLVAAHEIVSLPSASALAAQRRRLAGRPPAAGVVAVVADPVFQPDDPRFDGAAAAAGDGAWQAALERSGESFQRLPYARREAEALLALAPAGPRFTAFGFDADRDTVVSGALSGYRVVHFATHARVYADRPAASGILLSRLRRDGSPQAAEMLRSRDLYRLDLPAELVTLSACRTALGEEIRGEGLVGFTQGFLAAGAARVLVSLWEVDDESTAELMERFYRHHFRDGLAPAAALRRAQLSMWRQERWRSPYHWGAFVLQGEPR